jgi:hypothetical protein
MLCVERSIITTIVGAGIISALGSVQLQGILLFYVGIFLLAFSAAYSDMNFTWTIHSHFSLKYLGRLSLIFPQRGGHAWLAKTRFHS